MLSLTSGSPKSAGSSKSACSFKSVLLLSSALVALGPVVAHAETSFTDIGTLQDESVAYAISGDGTTVVGGSSIGTYSAYYWTAGGGIVGLDSFGGAPGQCDSSANAVSADGSVIVGYASGGASSYDAVRWDNGVLSALDNGYASDSEATGVSADGNVIVGDRDNAGTQEAFVWTSGSGTMSALSGLSGESYAYAVSANGNYVGGSMDAAGTQTAMRWSSGGGVEALGSLVGAGGRSTVYALNSDGSVATGYSYNGTGYEAFRWQEGAGMEGLGALTPTSESFGEAISADGKIITGQNVDSGTYTAFRWTAADGMQALTDILAAHHVDITGWALNSATGISADGKLIVGTGTFAGAERAYLMTTDGLITPEELAASVAPVGVTGGQAQSQFSQYINQLMFTARNIIATYFPHGFGDNGGNHPQYAAADTGTMSDASPAPQGMKMALYATGSASVGRRDDFSNDGLNGTTGALFNVGNDFAFGVGVLGSQFDQDTHLDGNARTRSLGGSIIGAYEPASGMRLYGTAALAHIDVDTDRHYLNGAAVDASRGNTDGVGYALAMRAGYEIPLQSQMSVMPYGELEWDKTSIDGYTETGGGIPATVGDQDAHQLVSRLGAELSNQFDGGVSTRLRAAWGHRLSGDTSSVYVLASGIGQSIQTSNGKDDWAELGASASYDVSRAVTLSANVDTQLSGSDNSNVGLTLALVYRLN